MDFKLPIKPNRSYKTLPRPLTAMSFAGYEICTQPKSIAGGGNCGVGFDGRRARLRSAHKRSERIEQHETIQERFSLMLTILPQRGLGSSARLGICIESSGKPATVFRVDQILFHVFPKAHEMPQILGFISRSEPSYFQKHAHRIRLNPPQLVAHIDDIVVHIGRAETGSG